MAPPIDWALKARALLLQIMDLRGEILLVACAIDFDGRRFLGIGYRCHGIGPSGLVNVSPSALLLS